MDGASSIFGAIGGGGNFSIYEDMATLASFYNRHCMIDNAL